MCVAELGYHPILASSMRRAPAGPVTFCQGLRAAVSLSRDPFMAWTKVMSCGDFVLIANAHSKMTSWWCLVQGSSQCATRQAASLSGTEVSCGTLPKDLAAARRSLASCVAEIPVAAELQRACADGLPVWILATKAPVCSNRWTLYDLLKASRNRLLCVAVVRFAPVSVPRFLTACLLAILCGSRASLIRLATALEDAMNAVFGVDRGSSNSNSPAMICLAAPVMLLTTSVALPLDWMLISSTMSLCVLWATCAAWPRGAVLLVSWLQLLLDCTQGVLSLRLVLGCCAHRPW